MSSNTSIAWPIAAAEGASTAVSLGAVVGLAHYNSYVEPLQNYLARRVIYPAMTHKAPSEADENDPVFQQSKQQAMTLIKGGAMLGAGFASHIPIQLALEGHCDAKSFRQVFVGKSAGLGVALGGILLLNKLSPHTIPAAQKIACPLISPYLPQGCDHGCRAAEETCRLMTVDIPSSVISGLVNYAITVRALRG